MTEKELILLGFEKSEEKEVESEFHYCTYTVADGFELISNASDEIEDEKSWNEDDNGWFVEFFNSDPTIRFTDASEVKALINLINKNIVKD